MTYSVNNTNNIEIERKFLVRDDSYKALATHHVRIRQGYLSLGANCSVRVRRWDDKGYITIKSRPEKGSFSRYEFEKEISAAEADELLLLALPGQIDKLRWIVPIEDVIFEVDEFMGDNAGLVVAEVELQSEEQAFPHPAFITKEVTNDSRYLNSQLSQHPYSTW